jgi:hypothetical protein
MNHQIEQLLSDAEGRYLEPTEQSAMIDYASSLEHRLAAMRAIQQHEAEIIEATMQAMWKEHPDMKVKHPHAYKKGVRDMTLVLRYSSMAMVRDCHAYLDQKVLYWFRTIVLAFEMSTPLRFAYAELMRQAEARLAPDHYAAIMPFLQQSLDILAPQPEESAAQ